MSFRGGEFSTGTTGNFQPELTLWLSESTRQHQGAASRCILLVNCRLENNQLSKGDICQEVVQSTYFGGIRLHQWCSSRL
jgi:hypothetical protein